MLFLKCWWTLVAVFFLTTFSTNSFAALPYSVSLPSGATASILKSDTGQWQIRTWNYKRGLIHNTFHAFSISVQGETGEVRHWHFPVDKYDFVLFEIKTRNQCHHYYMVPMHIDDGFTVSFPLGESAGYCKVSDMAVERDEVYPQGRRDKKFSLRGLGIALDRDMRNKPK